MYSEVPLGRGGALWRSSGSGAGVVPADGCTDLLLRHGEVLLAGPSTRWIATLADEASVTVGVRFGPGAAGGALPVDLADVRDAHVPLRDLLGPRAVDPLRRALLDSSGPSGSWRPATSWPALVHQRPGWGDVAVAAARGGRTARELAETLSWSERQLRRRMLTDFGYGYAALVRVARARRARALIAGGAALAQAAAEAGYADQPHMTREFGRVIGSTPGQVARSGA